MNIPYVNFSIHQQPAKIQEGGNMETTSTARSALREEVVASLEINAEKQVQQKKECRSSGV